MWNKCVVSYGPDISPQKTFRDIEYLRERLISGFDLWTFFLYCTYIHINLFQSSLPFPYCTCTLKDGWELGNGLGIEF